MIDLRSDTVTVPDEGMREAMASAEVGDDLFGEDPTVNNLQSRVADLLGKEAALFVPTGTMANQIALRLLTRPGDEVIIGKEAHVASQEAGAGPANAGVQFAECGVGGLFDAREVRDAFKPRGHIVFPPTTLVVVENTHNRGGGVIFPVSSCQSICTAATELGMRTYLDGARLFNASQGTGTPLSAFSAPFDLVAVSLSKGLGCPVGSVITGSEDLIRQSVRIRRMLGGAWRQAGILAAAGLYALDHNVDRLAEDHANARLIAEAIAPHPLVALDLNTVQSNIVVFDLKEPAPAAADFVTRLADLGVKVVPFGPRRIRATTHLNVSQASCRAAVEAILTVLSNVPRAPSSSVG